jgi:hypothetical protein
VRPSHERLPNEGYARPQLNWQCGLSDDGPPCALGPSAWGKCPAAAACHPTHEGDRWVCNRDALRGGPCDAGPGPDGHCGVVHRCTPYRSLRTRRRRFAWGCIAAVLGAAAMTLSGSWRNELIVPGPLSAHHAHLAQGANSSMRCAQCHAAANGTVAQWLGAATATPVAATSQTTLCLKCHDSTIPPEHATAAHSLAWETLQSPASGQGRRDPTAAIACSACHREHQGRMHDLTAMTNDACQACHREEYHSFAKGHPEFGAWPYERRTPIAFDHASHSLKHHPASKTSFDCASCHEADATGACQLTRGYADACAACHDKALKVSLAGGVSVVALPTLDTAVLEEAGADLGTWPEDADGDFDGAVPVLGRLLLTADAEAAEALAGLGPQFDYFDLDIESAEQVAQGAALASALKSLIDDLSERGADAVSERLTQILGRPPSEEELRVITTGLSAAATTYRERWFTDRSSESGLGDTAPGGEPPTGWSSDDASLSLRFHAVGHADPWLRAWLDILAEAATGPRAALVEPLLQAAMRPTAPGQCGSCHTVERTPSGRLAIQWRAAIGSDASSTLGTLTKFAHGSHLVQTQLRDCKACHAIDASAAASTGPTTYDPHLFVADFAPMSKAECATCHQATAAGDRCTQCHRYHGHGGANANIANPLKSDELRP